MDDSNRFVRKYLGYLLLMTPVTVAGVISLELSTASSVGLIFMMIIGAACLAWDA